MIEYKLGLSERMKWLFDEIEKQSQHPRRFNVDHLGNLILDGDDIPYSWRFNEQGYKAPTLSEIERAEQASGRKSNEYE